METLPIFKCPGIAALFINSENTPLWVLYLVIAAAWISEFPEYPIFFSTIIF